MFSAPGGWSNSWGSQGTQDYAYFETGFATGNRQLSRQQRDTGVRPFQGMRRHRKIRGPTRDQKIQIFFNITGNAMSFAVLGICVKLHAICVFVLSFLHFTSKHPFTAVEE